MIGPITPVSSLLESAPELDRHLLDAVRRFAKALHDEGHACRITTDVDPANEKLRWHVIRLDG